MDTTEKDDRVSAKIDAEIMEQVKAIAEREGYWLGRLIDKLLLAGIKAERL